MRILNFESILYSYEGCAKVNKTEDCFLRTIEENLMKIVLELECGSYTFSPPLIKIIHKPSPREIVSSCTRDKIVQRFIYNILENKINSLLIKDTFSSIIGRGNILAVKRIEKGIRRVSRNYSSPFFALKCDISRFFPSISKKLLLSFIKDVIYGDDFFEDEEKDFLYNLISKMVGRKLSIENSHVENLEEIKDLEEGRSILKSKDGYGIETGNITSSLFGNLYLNNFDHYIKEKLKVRYYFRYADDFLILDESKDKILNILSLVKWYLGNELNLSLSERKTKIISSSSRESIKFLGVEFKKYYKDVGEKTWNNFLSMIEEENKLIQNHLPTKEEEQTFLCRVNSYLGNIRAYKTFGKRKYAISQIDERWWSYFDYDPLLIDKIFLKKNKQK